MNAASTCLFARRRGRHRPARPLEQAKPHCGVPLVHPMGRSFHSDPLTPALYAVLHTISQYFSYPENLTLSPPLLYNLCATTVVLRQFRL